MTRLASRSPAAPFQSSRPAPMPQRPPQSTTTTEAQTLRQMVQEREEEIQRLRTALAKIATPMSGNPDLKDWQELAEYRAQLAENALDGGGDDNE